MCLIFLKNSIDKQWKLWYSATVISKISQLYDAAIMKKRRGKRAFYRLSFPCADIWADKRAGNNAD